MGEMLTKATLPGVLAQVRHVTPVRPAAAQGLVAQVYAQVEREFGMLAPPVILHSPAPQTLAASWAMLRESLLAEGTHSRETKEAVAAEVSRANSCPYCVDVHQATLDALLRTRPAPAGGPARSPELVAVSATFHYLNRMVNVFLGPSPLPPRLPVAARGLMLRLFGLIMRPAAAKPRAPGAAAALLAPAPLPADLAWARDVPHLAGAFAGAAAAIDAAGRRSVPQGVRELVTSCLDGWDGTPPGPSRAWLAEPVSGLPPAQRPAARLALLTAMASYQVDQEVVAEFRRQEPSDLTLVEFTAWASLAAARLAVRRSLSDSHPTPHERT
ncbi:carboxymuconolactone decarboxylase family protein [Nonomuraea jiangxiensis]|uniref:Alkylhydroperoxidase AhpD family core domain-containing protein n=1 Tax=Nonomuraea jiangxiensis TaxID=633440 RepID=A0A1G8IG08_9ACTN|nr:carboxymuconolactone decarboxylase family protein [Nonomuraea jiangxiensis]SDI17681.1 alkylhydroperoxidase AhpD family core domain-containing protein [Nonomuraea jiangxiensis]